MLKAMLARLHQGHRTVGYPDGPPNLPDRFLGRPSIDLARCPRGCSSCAEVCPTDAIVSERGQMRGIDLARCLFCGECARVCSEGALTFTQDYRLAARCREDLVIDNCSAKKKADALDQASRQILGHSLKLRQVSAGGCGACEADTNVLSTIVFDLGRFGIQFVASPRHADGLLVTGPVTENMHQALLKTYEAIPAPKIVIAVGACALAGGPYAGHEEVHSGVSDLLPIDLYIPGCPPHPVTILDGLLTLLGRI